MARDERGVSSRVPYRAADAAEASMPGKSRNPLKFRGRLVRTGSDGTSAAL